MYEYAKKRFIPSSVSTGLGTDRYIPNATRTSSRPFDAVARTNVQNIDVQCYENMPREQIVTKQVPYTMELSVPGHSFVCIGNPDQECPASVHRNTDPKDPWRNRQCATWRQGWEQQAAGIIASQGFRNQVTENILNVVGITGWRRWFTKPAEFVQVLDEKEHRERVIKVAAVLALAAGSGAILWTFLKDKSGAKVVQNPGGHFIKPSERTGAKMLTARKSKWKAYYRPDQLPDNAPSIVRQIFEQMTESARLLGHGRIVADAKPICVRTVGRLRTGEPWNWGWLMGTLLGGDSINGSLGYFSVNKSEEVFFTDQSMAESGSDPLSIHAHFMVGARHRVSHEKALTVASSYYQELEEAGVV
jgi:hypothetical protein